MKALQTLNQLLGLQGAVDNQKHRQFLRDKYLQEQGENQALLDADVLNRNLISEYINQNQDKEMPELIMGLQRRLLGSGNSGAVAYASTLDKFIPALGKSRGYNPTNLSDANADELFIVKNFIDRTGRLPQNQADWEDAVFNSLQGEDYYENRERFAGSRTTPRLKDQGVSAADPSQRVLTDMKTGAPLTAASGGDTLDQKLDGLTDDQMKGLESYSTIDSTLTDILDTFDPIFSGPLQGNAKLIGSKFINMPEFAKIKNKVGRLREIVYGLSGKQINEAELKWLNGILPQLENPDENFIVNAQEIQNWVKDKQEEKLIQLRNARRYTATKPLKEKQKPKGGKSQDFTDDDLDAALKKTNGDVDAAMELLLGGG